MTSPDRLAAAREAVIAGNLAKLRLLLKSGVPADAPLPGSSMLRLAARFGHGEVFDALVAAGARIDDPDESPAENPHKGKTALELAEALGHAGIAARLRTAG